MMEDTEQETLELRLDTEESEDKLPEAAKQQVEMRYILTCQASDIIL